MSWSNFDESGGIGFFGTKLPESLTLGFSDDFSVGKMKFPKSLTRGFSDDFPVGKMKIPKTTPSRHYINFDKSRIIKHRNFVPPRTKEPCVVPVPKFIKSISVSYDELPDYIATYKGKTYCVYGELRSMEQLMNIINLEVLKKEKKDLEAKIKSQQDETHTLKQKLETEREEYEKLYKKLEKAENMNQKRLGLLKVIEEGRKEHKLTNEYDLCDDELCDEKVDLNLNGLLGPLETQ